MNIYSDTAFIIPFQNDSQDRIDNLEIILKYLYLNFRDCKIFIPFRSTDLKTKQALSEPCILALIKASNALIVPRETDQRFFHKTELINQGIIEAKNAGCSIGFMYDCDVIIEPAQLNLSIDKLRNGLVDFIYPYDGRFINIERTSPAFQYLTNGNLPEPNSLTQYYKSLLAEDNGSQNRTDTWEIMPNSIGGCLGFRIDSMIDIGGYSTKFKSYGYEDNEIYYRITRIFHSSYEQIPGYLFHLSHVRGLDSCDLNPFNERNKTAFERVTNLNDLEFSEYVVILRKYFSS